MEIQKTHNTDKLTVKLNTKNSNTSSISFKETLSAVTKSKYSINTSNSCSSLDNLYDKYKNIAPNLKRFGDSVINETTADEICKSLSTIETVLSMKISKYDFKDNGYFDILGIMSRYSKNLKKDDCNDLLSAVNSLHKIGMIEDKDYIKFIQQMSLIFKVQNAQDSLNDNFINSVNSNTCTSTTDSNKNNAKKLS